MILPAGHVNQHFDAARDFGVSSERMNKFVKEIDRVTADKANIIEELDMQLMALQQKSTTSLIHSERMCMSEIGTQASRVGRKASSRVGSSDGRELQEVRAISSRAHADELESLSPRPAIGYPTPRLHSANLDRIPISDTYLVKSNSVQSHSISSYSPMPAR